MPDSDPEESSGRYDDRLNVPVRAEDKTKLRVEAAHKGMTMAEMARRKLFGDEREEAVPA